MDLALMNHIQYTYSSLPNTLNGINVQEVLHYNMSLVALRQLRNKPLSRTECIILCTNQQAIKYIWKNISLTKDERIYLIQSCCYHQLYELIRKLLVESFLDINDINQLIKVNPQYAYYIGYNYIDQLNKEDKKLMLYSLLYLKTITNEFRTKQIYKFNDEDLKIIFEDHDYDICFNLDHWDDRLNKLLVNYFKYRPIYDCWNSFNYLCEICSYAPNGLSSELTEAMSNYLIEITSSDIRLINLLYFIPPDLEPTLINIFITYLQKDLENLKYTNSIKKLITKYDVDEIIKPYVCLQDMR